jgi:diphthine-ammonia ligase
MAPQADAPRGMTAPSGLNVVALVSGGKDSFFAIAHCVANGHRVVALANLYPAASSEDDGQSPGESPSGKRTRLHLPDQTLATPATEQLGVDLPKADDGNDKDLNSFMYQTVGHEVLPLYASATGIPLYRQPIVGTSNQRGRDYDGAAGGASAERHNLHSARDPRRGSHGHDSERDIDESTNSARLQRDLASPRSQRTGLPGLALSYSADDNDRNSDTDRDETEAMVPLLRAIVADHPEANALSAGAILSTYQRTRVESVATRLGLVPLAYLWKFPVLPLPNLQPALSLTKESGAGPGLGWGAEANGRTERNDVQLLLDMAEVGFDARIIKVASGGLDESYLWERVTMPPTIARLKRAMARFGTLEQGAVLGEGGEFETLVVDGPPWLFKKKIIVLPENCKTVNEGGGTAWLKLRNAKIGNKPGLEASELSNHLPRTPELFDAKFAAVVSALQSKDVDVMTSNSSDATNPDDYLVTGRNQRPLQVVEPMSQIWRFVASANETVSTKTEIQNVITQITTRLWRQQLPANAIISTTILLRDMTDFPYVNSVYGSLFPQPNPPSRVTVSCGDCLPAGRSIAIYLQVHSDVGGNGRQGLHVQSRSYWAPANIGPYSQAISVPLASLHPRTGAVTANDEVPSPVKLVSVAGQIPLVPASMELLPSKDTSLSRELALSLQHLWRIGEDRKVQWWASVVAYFPARREAHSWDMSQKARLAARAWITAHMWGQAPADDDEDGESTGPDLWDRTHNSAYRTLVGGATNASQPSLPEWGLLAGHADSAVASKAYAPPCFAAEAQELPRGASVEWHAHLGLSDAELGSVQRWMSQSEQDLSGPQGEWTVLRLQLHCTSLASGDVLFLYTVISASAKPRFGSGPLEVGETPPKFQIRSVRSSMQKALAGCLDRLSTDGGLGKDAARSSTLTTLYVDTRTVAFGLDSIEGSLGAPIIPCRSLWDANGDELVAVGLYQQVFHLRSDEK